MACGDEERGFLYFVFLRRKEWGTRRSGSSFGLHEALLTTSSDSDSDDGDEEAEGAADNGSAHGARAYASGTQASTVTRADAGRLGFHGASLVGIQSSHLFPPGNPHVDVLNLRDSVGQQDSAPESPVLFFLRVLPATSN